MTVTVEEAQNYLPALLEQMNAGEQIVITRHERPIAMLIASPSSEFWEATSHTEELQSSPRICVMGTLLKVKDQAFSFKLKDGSEVEGLLVQGDPSEFAKLFGQGVVLYGKAVFLPTGRILRLEADDFRTATPNDEFFGRLPKSTVVPTNLEEIGRHNLLRLENVIGKWPGDETDEQVAEALRRLS